MKEIAYKIQLDGNSWCATDSNFINLQESEAGFGATPEEAIHELLLCKKAKAEAVGEQPINHIQEKDQFTICDTIHVNPKVEIRVGDEFRMFGKTFIVDYTGGNPDGGKFSAKCYQDINPG